MAEKLEGITCRSAPKYPLIFLEGEEIISNKFTLILSLGPVLLRRGQCR